jgi:protein SCO1/2
MSKKALYGILIAVLLPLVCYFILKKYSDHAVAMPHHFVYDSVSEGTRNGKQYSDTAWHRLSDFVLTNQTGSQVSWKDMQTEVEGKKEGKIVVASFFFTHCPNICPTTTRAMRMLQDGIKSSEKVGEQDADFVQLLSFSIDPERDSVPRLKNWADNFGVNPEKWWLLTGNKKTIYDLAIRQMTLSVVDGGNVSDSFAHTDLFVLIDKDRYVRGYYHSLKSSTDPSIDTANIARLANDIVLLSLEKDPKRKSPLSGKLELVAIVFSITAIGFILLVLFLKRQKKQDEYHDNKK